MTILFAYNGSESADAAIAAVGSLLHRDDANAVVLSVWEPLTVEALRATRFGGLAPIPTDVTEVDKRDARHAQRLAEHGARWPARLASRPAHPAQKTGLVDASHENEAAAVR
jgi:hypothetical protein